LSLRTLPAGLLAIFRAEKERTNKANHGYYMIPKRQKIGAQKSKNICGLRIAVRVAKAKEDGKDLCLGFGTGWNIGGYDTCIAIISSRDSDQHLGLARLKIHIRYT